MLRRKWTLRAHGQQVVFVKKSYESTEHVLMKALLWALYLPDYPGLVVEVSVGDRYKPDLVALDEHGEARFWAEAGEASTAKIRSLARRYRRTHFALAKWNASLDPLAAVVTRSLRGLNRRAPFDLLSFPEESASRFIDGQGNIHIHPDSVCRLRLN